MADVRRRSNVRSSIGHESLRDLAAIFDYSLDIVQHENDIHFSERNGTNVYYVFDENIFEMFVHPYDTFQYVDRNRPGGADARRHPDDSRNMLSAQTALFTSEILLAGRLPGQSDGQIYLSEWHRWELLSRLSDMMAEYSRGGDFRSAATEVLEKKNAIFLARRNGLRNSDVAAKSDDALLASDLRFLEGEMEMDDDALTPFIHTRDAAAFLANDRVIEPFQQLRRLLLPEVQSRLQDVTAIVDRRLSKGDTAEIQGEARRWNRLLRSEVTDRAVRAGRRPERGPRAIWNDAQTLAVVEWVSRQIDHRKERVVLVTGDGPLFDTYRRFFERDATRPASGAEPFLLRRPIQYSPLFLGEATRNVVDQRRKLFYSVQQTVELALVPLRLAAIGDQSLSADVLYRRHSLTLPPARDEGRPGVMYLAEAWTKFRSGRVESLMVELSADLDLTERLVIGFSGELLELRIDENEREVFEAAQSLSGAEQERLFSDYIDRSLEKMIESAVAVWAPIASKFFDRTIRVGNIARSRRVPVAVNHAMTNDGVGIDLVGLLYLLLSPVSNFRRGTTATKASAYIESPFDIFVAAGALALIANQWRLADHFCDIAINTINYFSKRAKISSRDAAEAYYLFALAKRFRLGVIVVRENFDGYVAARRLFDSAENALRLSEESAEKSGGEHGGSSRRSFSVFRFYSERAALHMFFALVCSEQSRALDGVEGAKDITTHARTAYREAAICLRQAIRSAEYRKGEGAPRLDSTAQELVRFQVLANIAAWYAIGPLVLGQQKGEAFEDLSQECSKHIEALIESVQARGDRLFLAEMLCFKIWQGRDVLASRSQLLGLSVDGGIGLEIDNRLLAMLVLTWAKAAGRGEDT